MWKFAWNLTLVSVTGLAANAAIDAFVIKSDTNDPSGFILQTAGFGMDDIVRGFGIGLVVLGALHFLGKD